MARPQLDSRTAPTPRVTLWVPGLIASLSSGIYLALIAIF